jgi:zinc ribbon protein
MYCDACGQQVADTAAFCSKCGKSLQPLQAPARASGPSGRVSGHFRLLGILWIIESALRVLPGLVLLALSAHSFSFLPPEVPPVVPGILHAIFPAIGGFLLLTGAIGVAAGWGLLERQAWARPLAMVLGVLGLFHFPLGTALGVYTLWVLWPESSEREYRTLAQV